MHGLSWAQECRGKGDLGLPLEYECLAANQYDGVDASVGFREIGWGSRFLRKALSAWALKSVVRALVQKNRNIHDKPGAMLGWCPLAISHLNQ